MPSLSSINIVELVVKCVYSLEKNYIVYNVNIQRQVFQPTQSPNMPHSMCLLMTITAIILMINVYICMYFWQAHHTGRRQAHTLSAYAHLFSRTSVLYTTEAMKKGTPPKLQRGLSMAQFVRYTGVAVNSQWAFTVLYSECSQMFVCCIVE